MAFEKYILVNSLIIKLKIMSKKIEFNTSIRELSTEDLKARIAEDEVRLKKMQFAHAVTPLENPMTIRGVRRDLSRLKGELRKRELVG